jgi:hypothetical protein
MSAPRPERVNHAGARIERSVSSVEYERTPAIDDRQNDLYEKIAAGEFADGPNGRIAFAVSTTAVGEGRGDLYVALGLAKYLSRAGWGVRLWPMSHWGEDVDDDVDVVVSMLESFVPGLMRPETARIAWVRNWTDSWATQPFLDQYDAIWSSSAASAEKLSEAAGRPVSVVPIAADAELFTDIDGPIDMTVASTVNHWGNARQIHSVLTEVASRVDVSLFGEQGKGSEVHHALHAGRISYFGLPDVYHRSLVVLDDLIDQAKAYGNQNSRLFESIAAGAVPITNVRDGLDELGLSAVPTYTTAADLIETVNGLNADRERYERLLEELRLVVRERHTFEVRAAETEPLIRAAIAESAARAGRPALLRPLAAERANQIYTSTLSDLRQKAIDDRDERIEELEARAEAAERRVERLNSALVDVSARLAAYENRKLTRIESGLRRSVHLGTGFPGRVRSTLSRWSR